MANSEIQKMVNYKMFNTTNMSITKQLQTLSASCKLQHVWGSLILF